MVNRSKNKGTAWETEIVRYLIEGGAIHAERRALKGKLDRGDVAGVPGVVIEAKSLKSIPMAAVLDETLTEMKNADVHIGFAWIKRRGRTSAARGYALMEGETVRTLLIEAGYIVPPEVEA
jgi:hypothetical protein